MNNKLRVIVIGATGMLGNAVLRVFKEDGNFNVIGTVRSMHAARFLSEDVRRNLVVLDNIEDTDQLIELVGTFKPNVVINCVGIVKQLSAAGDPLKMLPINAILPHRIARICEVANARFVHVSTDCVFSGAKGMYSEMDFPDGRDLYGRSKLLGEVDYENAITLRTSIIGHELNSSHSLVDWFLSQDKAIKGYNQAIFSGLPTVEIGRIIVNLVLNQPTLRGVYHVSSAPISKYDLLVLIARIYKKNIDILPSDDVVIDRSLDSSRFKAATGFSAKPWDELIRSMHEFG